MVCCLTLGTDAEAGEGAAGASIGTECCGSAVAKSSPKVESDGAAGAMAEGGTAGVACTKGRGWVPLPAVDRAGIRGLTGRFTGCSDTPAVAVEGAGLVSTAEGGTARAAAAGRASRTGESRS